MKLTSFLAGVGVGAAVTMIFAPRSGDETREVLSEKAEEGRRYVQDRVQELRNTTGEITDQGKELVNRQKKAVTAAAQAAKDTYVRESEPRPTQS